MTPAVQAVGVRRAYSGVEALRGVSVEVGEGEVLAVLGPNGAGKTTLIEILEGYRRCDAGEVSVLGEDPQRGGRQLREQLGIVLQECAMPPFLTVDELVRHTAGYYRRPRDPDEIVELVGLSDKRGSRVKALSGGQQRRLDLALALVGDPRLVFLDEPTTGFDPSARRGAWEVIRGIRSLGKTVLLTTHYMDEAQTLADRIVVIAAGVVIAEGDAASIGGRDQRAATIRFRLPPGVGRQDLPAAVIAGVEIARARDGEGGGDVGDGDELVVETAEPTPVLAALCGWAAASGIELPGLSVTRPSLEDVYLELTRGEP